MHSIVVSPLGIEVAVYIRDLHDKWRKHEIYGFSLRDKKTWIIDVNGVLHSGILHDDHEARSISISVFNIMNKILWMDSEEIDTSYLNELHRVTSNVIEYVEKSMREVRIPGQ